MITLKEVLKLNPFVTLLKLDVRNTDRRLIKRVIIGKDYRLSVHQKSDWNRGKLEYIDNDINYHHRVRKNGFSETSYDIDWKAIPKEYLDMEIDLLHSIGDRFGTNEGMELWADIIPTQMRWSDVADDNE